MTNERTDTAGWWNKGETCERCGIPWCFNHSPNRRLVRATPAPVVGPLGTEGLQEFTDGPIPVLFLDYHHRDADERSKLGVAVLHGKSYDGRPGSPAAAAAVAQECCFWMKRVTGGWRSGLSAVVPVPAKSERRGLSLPLAVSQELGKQLGLPVVQPLRWRPGAGQAKDRRLTEVELEYSLDVVGAVPEGGVLLVDDLVRSGQTLSAVARALRKCGATRVTAFAPILVKRDPEGGSAVF